MRECRLHCRVRRVRLLGRIVTIGFQELGGLTAKSPKSLMRMLSPNGNPQARNLFEIISCLQEREGLRLKVQAVR